MTRLPKGWRGKTGATGVYVKAGTPYKVKRDDHVMAWKGFPWCGFVGESLNPLTHRYAKATAAMAAVDRLIKEQENA